ncbi:ROK family protein [Nocardioides bruguierae]|uniref:ROK family protein n=1 Tax=Nocardioides bruguierae TaxID=2945102 RepID=A0A9X2D905_9ACTN|nr:ROK family protein [Nocardioides bruguierae]MCL8026934.1 ROK family protein [Nocardioides bruguierae]MCM0621361.1 ROK family protein [Nocardioides bruguierae]
MGVRVGVDVGGTKVLAGVVAAPEGPVRSRTSWATVGDPAPYETLLAHVAQLIADLGGPAAVDGVGVGVPGPLDPTGEQLSVAPNLAGLGRRGLRTELEQAWGVPVRLENDANVAALGEARAGAGRGSDSFLYVCLGTGIGGAVVHEGALVRGAFRAAGEIGHVPIRPGGLPCGCGGRGCYEQYASGTALGRLARERGWPDSHSLVAAAAAGDLPAIAVLDVFADAVAEGLVHAVLLLDPEVVVLGGGVAAAGTLLSRAVERALGDRLVTRAAEPLPEVRTSTLGPDAAVLGAAYLVDRPTAPLRARAG